MHLKSVLISMASIAAGGCAAIAPITSEPPAKADWRLEGRAMVAAADQRAVDAALEVLRAGGHAVDAAIAAHAILGLVEPQSSGLGGGAFMLVYERETDDILVYDGRETAPASASPDMFLVDGAPMGFVEAWQSGKSVGVPGAVAMYKAAHDAHGQSNWSDLFGAAITLAEDGFVVTPRLATMLSNPRLRGVSRLDDNPATAAYFYPNGEPLAVGDIRDNPDYAATLSSVASEGPDAFYQGVLPGLIAIAAQEAPNGGSLTQSDIADYTPIVRNAVCGDYETYKICSAPPPSSGSVAQPLIMGLYERLTDGLDRENEDAFLAAFVDAQRLAYADRDHYVADADFVSVPIQDLVDPIYMDARAQQRLAPDAPSAPGDPGAVLRDEPIVDMWGRDATEPGAGTTHLSIVDFDGNAVSMTATVEAPFGSSRWAGGFLLNNELTDFSKIPEINGRPVANAPAPGKRPRSSMSPTLVFDETGELYMVTGSPGGNSIIAYVAKSLVGVLDWEMSAQDAVDLPNIIARGDTVNVEIAEANGQAAADTLKSMGYAVREREGENSGLHVIIARADGFEGGADKRREGVAVEILRDD